MAADTAELAIYFLHIISSALTTSPDMSQKQIRSVNSSTVRDHASFDSIALQYPLTA